MGVFIAPVSTEKSKRGWCLFVPRSIYNGLWSTWDSWASEEYVCIPFSEMHSCLRIAENEYSSEECTVTPITFRRQQDVYRWIEQTTSKILPIKITQIRKEGKTSTAP